jgi:hypothetical protein
MKRCKNVLAWTDYPIIELGDVSGLKAPIRHLHILAYDGDKYATVEVVGTKVITNIKAGYLYKKPGRYGSVKIINRRKLERMINKDVQS